MARLNGAGVKLPRTVRISWGKKVKQVRGNTSQEKYAAFLGIDQATLSKIEHGQLAITDDMKWLICGRSGRLIDDVFPMPPVVPTFLMDDAAEAEAS